MEILKSTTTAIGYALLSVYGTHITEMSILPALLVLSLILSLITLKLFLSAFKKNSHHPLLDVLATAAFEMAINAGIVSYHIAPQSPVISAAFGVVAALGGIGFIAFLVLKWINKQTK